MGFAVFLAKRLFSTVLVMGTVAFIIFALLRFAPGDPAAIIAGDNADPANLQAIRERMGLERPFFVQFGAWLLQIVRGDLGTSLISNVPVLDVIKQRIGPSLSLSVSTILLSTIVAVPLGVLAAWKRGTVFDRMLMAFSVTGFSLPVFLTAYLLILVFSLELGVLPIQGYKPISEGFWPFVQRLILPTLSLSTIYIALFARITRSSVSEVLEEDFIRTARAKGLSERAVLVRHALGNAAVPILTIIGIGITMLIGGVVVTESVFNLPGIGRLVVEAVLARDYPIIQALVLLFSFLNIIINLAIDLLYNVVDPRTRIAVK